MREPFLKNLLNQYEDLIHLPHLAFPERPQHLSRASLKVPLITRCSLVAEKTFSLFFELIDRLQLENHSKGRREFWSSYLESGAILTTWLALAPDMQKFVEKKLHTKPTQYSQLHKDRRVEVNHAVLLMRLPGLIVAEWSHLGKCHFWLASNKEAPSFYKNIYQKEELTSYPDYIQQHYYSSNGSWQKSAATWLRDKAGLPIPFGLLL